ncbi:MAG: type II toxin-antitoxin system RelE/ParE family toxin [Lachnospiraceae bacterium]|nr:type II toxin-antitoxin system RelE/ParE family toxin [Lachnospiraceae bacterium]
MPKLIYTPKALDDLQGIKVYVAKQFGEGKAKVCVKEITSTAKQLELYPGEGPRLKDLIEYPTDYHYLVVKPNYVFYRVEGDTIRVIRILNEKQDFLQILFGITSMSEEGEDYWGD